MPPSAPLPAHETKTLQTLEYPLSPTSITLALTQPQSSLGAPTTGSTLWLGAQLLSLYLPHLYPPPSPSSCNGGKIICRSAIDLGSGTGLTALTLAVCGFSCVIATDIPPVLDEVLRVNIDANTTVLQHHALSVVEVRKLDWVEFSASGSDAEEGREMEYDLLTTADTIYEPSLIHPLFASIRKLNAKRVLLAVEVRDHQVVEHAERVAGEMGYRVVKVRQGKIAALMKDAQWEWTREEWEGVEIWELKRREKRRSGKEVG